MVIAVLLLVVGPVIQYLKYNKPAPFGVLKHQHMKKQ